MIPVQGFEEIIEKVLSRNKDDAIVTIGILVADWRQPEAN